MTMSWPAIAKATGKRLLVLGLNAIAMHSGSVLMPRQCIGKGVGRGKHRWAQCLPLHHGRLGGEVRTTSQTDARRGFCKQCKKYYDDSKGLEAHEKRHHPRPPSQDGEREV
jgi:hypothetical protein